MTLELNEVLEVLKRVETEEKLTDDELKKVEFNVNEAVHYAIDKIKSEVCGMYSRKVDNMAEVNNE